MSSKLLVLLPLLLVNCMSELTCTYYLNNYYGYACRLSDDAKARAKEEILGTHLAKRCDDDVVFLEVTFIETFRSTFCRKFNNLKRISSTSSQLKTFTGDSLSSCILLTHLLLNNNNLTKLSAETFHRTTTLLELTLTDNQLSYLNQQTFIGLINLQKLFLSNNKLESIHPKLLKQLIGLQHLDLNSNAIAYLKLGTFVENGNLQHLNLQYNPIKRINSNAFAQPNVLTFLDISYTQLEQVDEKLFVKLSHLSFLYADKNSCIDEMFIYIPNSTIVVAYFEECFSAWRATICEFSTNAKNNNDNYTCMLNGLSITTEAEDGEFDEINFVHNEEKTNQDVSCIRAANSIINFLPASLLSHFCNVKVLSLRNVQLRKLSLEDSLQNCSQLEELDVGMNEISALSKGSFGKCHNITSIMLFKNHIAAIDGETFAHMKQLKTLDLSSNKLIIVQREAFTSLRELEKLFLSGNAIEAIDVNLFSSMKRLRVLRLNFNRIASLNPMTFAAVSSLRELHLGNNLIQQVEAEMFAKLIKLKYLNLEGNRLRNLKPNTFPPENSIQYLDISNNSIEAIHESNLKRLKVLKYLFANNNICVDADFDDFDNIADLMEGHFKRCYE